MSAGTALWVALALCAIACELAARGAALRALARRVGTSLVGRIGLVAVWGWLGWHLFARHGSVLSALVR